MFISRETNLFILFQFIPASNCVAVGGVFLKCHIDYPLCWVLKVEGLNFIWTFPGLPPKILDLKLSAVRYPGLFLGPSFFLMYFFMTILYYIFFSINFKRS